VKVKLLYVMFSICLLFLPAFNASFVSLSASPVSSYDLPPPLFMNTSIENVIQRRTCIRDFSNEPVTDEQLSTILWSAYGVRDDGIRTVSPINGSLAVKIYVIKEDAVYWYDPYNHSLVFHKAGDYRGIGQYWAPVLLGFVWNRDLNKNENIVGAQIGQVGQNIILAAVSLGLGTVPTNDFITPLMNIDLPLNEAGKLVMPLGHPNKPTVWKYRPLYFSLLPPVRDSSVSLTEVLKNRNLTQVFGNRDLTMKNISQMLWACYGYSHYVDVPNSASLFGQRHRTVPSGHGYYPLCIYAVTSSGIYRYVHGLKPMDLKGLAIVSFLWKIKSGDYREKIAKCSESFLKDAPLLIISVLDLEHTKKRGLRGDDFSSPQIRWVWYYEAGSCAQNVLLDSAAWGLSGNIVEISDQESVRSLLRLNQDFIPLFVTPVGGSSK